MKNGKKKPGVNKWIAAGAIIAIAVLAALYYLGSEDQKQLESSMLEGRAIPVMAEFAICAPVEGLDACRAKVVSCGLKVQDNANDWPAVPSDTIVNCVKALASSDAVSQACSTYVNSVDDSVRAIRRENPVAFYAQFRLSGASYMEGLASKSLLELGNCMTALKKN